METSFLSNQELSELNCVFLLYFGPYSQYYQYIKKEKDLWTLNVHNSSKISQHKQLLLNLLIKLYILVS